jgi:hypothetical protein
MAACAAPQVGDVTVSSAPRVTHPYPFTAEPTPSPFLKVTVVVLPGV